MAKSIQESTPYVKPQNRQQDAEMSDREYLQLARKRDRLVSREVDRQLSLEGYSKLS